jgi:hypothetical protein
MASKGAKPSSKPSRDLAHDLQFRTLEQLGNLSLGGAGVTITLIGGLLKNVGPFVWMATAEFAIGALAALLGEVDLTNCLLQEKEPTRTKNYTMAAVFFLAMGVGSLATSVFLSR